MKKKILFAFFVYINLYSFSQITYFTSGNNQERNRAWELHPTSIYDSTYKCFGGVYYTYDDFLTNKIADMGVLSSNMLTLGYYGVNAEEPHKVQEITFIKLDSSMLKSVSPIGMYYQTPKKYRQPENTIKFKDNKIWGFRTTAGLIYRVNKTDHAAYILITSGPYCLWGDHNILVSYDKKGKIYRIDMNEKDERFSKHFFISKDSNGELFNCNNKVLKELFKDDPEILSDLNENPINDRDSKKGEWCLSNILKWVAMYNDSHK